MIWFFDNLDIVFWGLVFWIFLSITFCGFLIALRRWYIRRNPLWEESEEIEWHMTETEELPTIVEMESLTHRMN